MADQQQQQQISAPFPTPPPFYKHFTKQNLAQLRQVRKEASQPSSTENDSSSREHKDIDILSLPPELRYLTPPSPPQDGKYASFGASLDHNQPDQSLAAAGIEQLYPSSHPSNPQPHLIALARSLLTTFLSLVGILSQNPELYEERVETLQTIMFNMHELINQYRPHQARETLILMMERRVEALRGEMRAIREARERVGKLMRGLEEGGGEARVKVEGEEMSGVEADGGEEVVGDEKRRVRQRAAWAALERTMG